MENYKLQYTLINALVTNIDDSTRNDASKQKKGRVQIRLLPYMLDVPEDRLPWYDPFVGAGNTDSFTFNPPRIGSNIIVIPTSNSLRDGYYLTPDYIEGFFDYSKIETLLGSITELSATDYGKTYFNLNESGNLHFYNTETGEEGFLNKNGTYLFYGSNGEIVIYNKDQDFKFYNDKVTAIFGNSGDVSIVNDNTTFLLNNDGTYSIDGTGKIECKASGQISINNDNFTVDT